MFCRNCGREIADNSKFCVFCGAKQQSAPVEQSAPMPGAASAPVEQSAPMPGAASAPEGQSAPMPGAASAPEGQSAPMPGAAPAPGGNAFGAQQGAYGYQAPQPPAGGAKRKKKLLPAVLFAGIGVILIAIIVLIAGLVKSGAGSGKASSKVFFLKNDELSVITDFKASDPDDVELQRIKDGDYASGYELITLSPDKSYLYFFSKYDSGSGTLCRIPVGKISKSEEKNGKLIEEIDTKVSSGFVILDDNSVVYKKKGDELNWWNGGKDGTVELGDCNSSFYLTKDQKYVVYMNDDDLLYCELSQKAKEAEIDSGVVDLISVGESDFILYSRDENYNEDIGYTTVDYYIAGINKKAELVAEDAGNRYGVSASDRSFYYAVPAAREACLYDYVNDPYAEDDASKKEPTRRDFLEDKVKPKEAISSYDWDYYNGDIEEIVEEECYEQEEGVYSYYNDSDWNYYYYDETANQWYAAFDSDAYWDAYYAYEDIGRRIDFRESLKEYTITDRYDQLYFYSNGNTTTVCDSMDNIMDWTTSAVVYTKRDLEGGAKRTVNIDDYPYYYVSDVYDDVYYGSGDSEEYETYYFYSPVSGECEIDALDTFNSVFTSKDSRTVVLAGNYEDGVNTLLACKLSSSGLGDAVKMTDKGVYVGSHENTFYYLEDYDGNEGTLYAFDGSRSTMAAKDITGGEVFVTGDGTVISYSDMDSDGGVLSVYDQSGKGERVARDVTDFTYLGGGCYLLRKDDDLYYRNKKGEESRLAKNIRYYVYPGEIDGYWLFY